MLIVLAPGSCGGSSDTSSQSSDEPVTPETVTASIDDSPTNSDDPNPMLQQEAYKQSRKPYTRGLALKLLWMANIWCKMSPITTHRQMST